MYYDTAATPLYSKNIFKVVRIGILDKILFGSDYPLISPAVTCVTWKVRVLNSMKSVRSQGKCRPPFFHKLLIINRFANGLPKIKYSNKNPHFTALLE